MKMKNVAAVAMAGCMAASLAACGGSASSAASTETSTAASTEAATGEESTGVASGFTVQLGSNPETLDPALNNAIDGANTLITVFEPLLLIDENNEVIPGQAESYTVSEDGLTWTFTMRDGLKWSDGSDLTAKDFEYSFKRLAAPDTAAPYAETVVGMIDGYADATGNPDKQGNMTTEPDFDALNVVASEDGKTLTPDDQGILDSLHMNVEYRSLYGIDKVNEFVATANTNRYTENDMFFAGKQLFRFDGTWLDAMIKANNADLNYGVALIPGTKAHPEDQGASRYETNSLAIPVTCQNEEAAWDFIKYFTNSDATKQLLISMANLPVLPSLYDDPDMLAAMPSAGIFIDALKNENGIQYATIADLAQYTSLINEELDYVYLLFSAYSERIWHGRGE